jgi:hypothetical protein
MLGITTHFGLATGVGHDDVLEPWHHNRLADVVDRVLGGVLSSLLGDGVHSGWLLTGDGTVTPGDGLVAACWCTTQQERAISGLAPGATNYVFAEPVTGSAPAGEVAFAARLHPVGAARSVLLGSLEAAPDGTIVSVANDLPGCARDLHGLRWRTARGELAVASVPAGGQAEVIVEHGDQCTFRMPGVVGVETAPSGFTWSVTDGFQGSRFVVVVRNGNADALPFVARWTRCGITDDESSE